MFAVIIGSGLADKVGFWSGMLGLGPQTPGNSYGARRTHTGSTVCSISCGGYWPRGLTPRPRAPIPAGHSGDRNSSARRRRGPHRREPVPIAHICREFIDDETTDHRAIVPNYPGLCFAGRRS